jgi:hypothetical protein
MSFLWVAESIAVLANMRALGRLKAGKQVFLNTDLDEDHTDYTEKEKTDV